MPCAVERVGFQLCQCLIRRTAVEVAPVLVVGVNLLSKTQSRFRIVGDKQSNSLSATLDTSGGVDTRTYLIDEVADIDGLAFDTGDLHDGLQTHGREGIDGTQAVESEDTVLARHGHDVAGDTHRQQRQQLIYLLRVDVTP